MRRITFRMICCLAVLLLVACCLPACGGSEKEAKSEKTKEDPGEAQRKKAIKRAKDRPKELEEDEDDYLMIVNKKYGLTAGYEPNDLITVETCDEDFTNEDCRQMKGKAAEALEKLFAAARKEDHEIVLRTGYRAYGYQKSLYESYVNSKGEKKADTYSAKPGYSEHQTGLCCDVGIEGVKLNSFTNTRAAIWLEKNCWKYGFILRYPRGKEDITGYIYESWHIRYVGKKAAAYMHKHDMTLEEYLDLD